MILSLFLCWSETWSFTLSEDIHSPAPRCGTIASVAFILWRVKLAANKLCWRASICKYNTQGSYSYNHRSGQRGSTIDY
jgi:hypothetical protein